MGPNECLPENLVGWFSATSLLTCFKFQVVKKNFGSIRDVKWGMTGREGKQ